MAASLWIGALLAAACGGFWLFATPRMEGPLQGWPGTLAGLAAAALAVWQAHAGGLGLAVSVAWTLGVAMLALPVWSWWHAARRRAARSRGAAR